jgi:predicted ferric reductase
MKKLVFYGIPLTAVIVWILEGFFLGHFQTLSIQSSLAKLTGLLGIAFLSLNFITAARYDIIEKWFGGLDIVYKYHKLAGKLA